MNKTLTALKMAEEALVKANHFHDYEDELAAIREALAEPVKRRVYPCPTCGQYQSNSFSCGHSQFVEHHAPVDAKAIREQALEEAAKVCEEYALESLEAITRTGHAIEDGLVNGGYVCATTIRGMKRTTEAGRGSVGKTSCMRF